MTAKQLRGPAACLLVAAIVLVAVNQRPAVVGVGPLLGEIRAGLGLSGTAAGVLTTLPVLCFGLLSPLAPKLARRYGADRVVGATMLVLALGIGMRSVPTPALIALFAGTAVIGAAIAVANVLMPSIIKRDFGLRAGPVLGLYAMAMSAGAAVAAGVVVPLQDGLGIGWRSTLLLMLPVALGALVLWKVAVRTVATPAAIPSLVAPPSAPQRITLWRDPVAWAVTIFMGTTSLQFYGAFAWFPTMVVDHGVSEQAAGWWLALMGAVGAISSLIVPVLAARSRSQERFVLLIVALYVASWVGMLIAPASGAPVWASLMGFAQGAGISLALTLIVVRAPDAAHAAELSGMAQTVGYLLAAAGPLLLGVVHDLAGGWTVPMALMLAALVPVLVFGVQAGRPRLVAAPGSPTDGPPSAAPTCAGVGGEPPAAG